jgi:hypothetical protein
MSFEDLSDRLDTKGSCPPGTPCPPLRSAGWPAMPRSFPAILGAQGQVLDVGRTSRLVTTSIWTALVLRDQHCAFPGCSRLPLPATPTTSNMGPTADPPPWTT